MLPVALAYPAPGSGEFVPALLARYKSLISPYLRATAPPSDSLMGRMIGYQMGWADRHGRARSLAPGKLVRPSLCLWACEAAGGEAAWALPAAGALELVHNFTLVHDDIQDGDRERRGRPTVWAIWGAAQGINAGDALHALAFATLTARGAHRARRFRAARCIANATLEVIEGQCSDLELEGRAETSPRRYLRMIRAKTGALLGASLESGALMAGASGVTARRFRAAGRLLGAAFQIRDDWLGAWGDPTVTGKSRGSDIARRKVTYPVVAAHAALAEPRRARLRELYRTRDPSTDGEIRLLLEEAGRQELTSATPGRFAERAIATMTSCGLEPRFVADFAEVARYVANRTR